tara:strand:+ start:1580 stop:2011 length:432 start_codon:yes stop_codon:yes gene_type:complete
MSKVKFIKSISEMTKEMAEKIKDKKIIMKSKDPQIQKALDKKVDELTGMKTLPSGRKIKKRMTAKERKEMSKPFNKMLADAQKAKKGRTEKQFDAAVKKDMAEQARIDKVKKENMAAAKKPKKFSGGGIALRGLGRAFMKSKR